MVHCQSKKKMVVNQFVNCNCKLRLEFDRNINFFIKTKLKYSRNYTIDNFINPKNILVIQLHVKSSKGEIKKYQLSRGAICMANFIPPAKGASLGSYCMPKS